MSISNVQNATATSNATSSGAKSTAASDATGTSFADTLTQVSNGTRYTDAEVKSFFAGKPSAQQIADKAAELGLTEDQIDKAMTVGGLGTTSDQALRDQIEGFVANTGNGYAWNAQGVLTTAPKSTIQGVSTDKAMPATADIKAFYATNPTDAQVTAKVKSLGLNAAQMVQFQATGIGMNMSQISAPVLETMYVDAANRLGADIGGGKNGGWTSYFSPTLGRAVTKSEMQTFFSSNPTQSQIFQKASELGLGVGAVNNMMVGLGVTKAESTNSAYANMDISLYRGTDGYSVDQYGHIVSGGGHVWVGAPDSGAWRPRTPADGTNLSATA